MGSQFRGRSLSVVNDFSVDEQYYLYQKTRELKEAVRKNRDSSGFRINDAGFSVYLLFLEDSTRTKESFRNAAKFHNARVNTFDAHSSSFNKSESLTDTVKMLFGYGSKSMFIIRSKQEGVCRWLEYVLGEYAASSGMPVPSFINAGDGKHEHPTQEFLDEYTFLEQKGWDRESIHIALVGDLFHGRTVHSKADGLQIYKNVLVDLIAPEDLAMPKFYEEKMRQNGFEIRKFETIREYLDKRQIAPIWYFTRLQLERMGDKVLEKAGILRKAVTFFEEYIDSVPAGTKFYHPLPRHREFPTIPHFLDMTALNGWDGQSVNGYFTRIIEIALLYGRLGDDFAGQGIAKKEYIDDFVEEAAVNTIKRSHDYKVGIKPVENGIVIDHIGRGQPIEAIWNHIDKIRHILKLNYRSSHGVYHSNERELYKGIISLPDIIDLDEREIKMLGAVAPGCTLNIVKNNVVTKKYRLHMPPRVYNFAEISCKNENCISNPANFENVLPEFLRSPNNTFVCKYCEREYSFQDIWSS